MRRSFSIIELIFAIVILAICTMAIPRIVSQTAESTSFAIKQELVLNAKTLMAQILKSPWDSSYKNQGHCASAPNPDICAITNTRSIPIYTIAGDFASRPGIDKTENSAREFGTYIPADKDHFGKGKVGHSFGYGDQAYNDIDDYTSFGKDDDNISKISTNLLDNTTGEFILDTKVSAEVRFVSDAMKTSGSDRIANLGRENLKLSNIKMIEVTAEDTRDKDRFVTLRSYAFNIGISFPKRMDW